MAVLYHGHALVPIHVCADTGEVHHGVTQVLDLAGRVEPGKSGIRLSIILILAKSSRLVCNTAHRLSNMYIIISHLGENLQTNFTWKQVSSTMVLARYLTWQAGLNLGKLESDPTRITTLHIYLTLKFYFQASEHLSHHHNGGQP